MNFQVPDFTVYPDTIQFWTARFQDHAMFIGYLLTNKTWIMQCLQWNKIWYKLHQDTLGSMHSNDSNIYTSKIVDSLLLKWIDFQMHLFKQIKLGIISVVPGLKLVSVDLLEHMIKESFLVKEILNGQRISVGSLQFWKEHHQEELKATKALLKLSQVGSLAELKEFEQALNRTKTTTSEGDEEDITRTFCEMAILLANWFSERDPNELIPEVQIIAHQLSKHIQAEIYWSNMWLHCKSDPYDEP